MNTQVFRFMTFLTGIRSKLIKLSAVCLILILKLLVLELYTGRAGNGSKARAENREL